MTKDLVGVVIEYYAQAPLPQERNDTRFPIKFYKLALPTLMTLPTPSMPKIAGRVVGKYFPTIWYLSEGLRVEPSTFMSSCPYLMLGIDASSRIG